MNCAVITGAGSGIGRAVALRFIDAGYKVALMGRRLEPLAETLGLRGTPPGHVALPVDVRSEAQVEAGFAAAVERLGGIDVLFNNAGTFAGGASFDTVTLDNWRTVIDTNLTGAFLCARAAFIRMKTGGGGRIINNGSISAHAPRPQAAAYTCSKHAITGLTKTISLEGRAWNIACGQIDIGNAATELTAGFSSGMLQADGERRGEPVMDVGNVADAVLFMAGLPLDANVQFMTVMATTMPFIGRG
jgi:NAD(P)-dependent dehydrogenase (short-subunit alcohol dehydrogenase family)